MASLDTSRSGTRRLTIVDPRNRRARVLSRGSIYSPDVEKSDSLYLVRKASYGFRAQPPKTPKEFTGFGAHLESGPDNKHTGAFITKEVGCEHFIFYGSSSVSLSPFPLNRYALTGMGLASNSLSSRALIMLKGLPRELSSLRRVFLCPARSRSRGYSGI